MGMPAAAKKPAKTAKAGRAGWLALAVIGLCRFVGPLGRGETAPYAAIASPPANESMPTPGEIREGAAETHPGLRHWTGVGVVQPALQSDHRPPADIQLKFRCAQRECQTETCNRPRRAETARHEIFFERPMCLGP